MDGISYHHICSFSPNLRSPEVTPSPDLRNQFFVSLIPWSLGTQLGPRGPWLSVLAPVTLVLSRKVHIAAAAAAAACPAAYVTAARRASLASGKDLWRVHCSVTEEENKAQEHLESDRIFSIFTLFFRHRGPFGPAPRAPLCNAAECASMFRWCDVSRRSLRMSEFSTSVHVGHL